MTTQNKIVALADLWRKNLQAHLRLSADDWLTFTTALTAAQEPVYFIRPNGPSDEHDSKWHEATPALFGITPEVWRRKLYTHPAPTHPAALPVPGFLRFNPDMDGEMYEYPGAKWVDFEAVRAAWPQPPSKGDAKDAELLSKDEQKAVLDDLMGIECLLNRHDCWIAEADASDMSECVPHHEKRVAELLRMGRAIIAQDPELWSDESKAAFVLRYSEKNVDIASKRTRP